MQPSAITVAAIIIVIVIWNANNKVPEVTVVMSEERTTMYRPHAWSDVWSDVWPHSGPHVTC